MAQMGEGNRKAWMLEQSQFGAELARARKARGLAAPHMASAAQDLQPQLPEDDQAHERHDESDTPGESILGGLEHNGTLMDPAAYSAIEVGTACAIDPASFLNAIALRLQLTPQEYGILLEQLAYDILTSELGADWTAILFE